MTVPSPHIRELMEAEIRNHPRRMVRVIDYLMVATYDHGGRTPAGHAAELRYVIDRANKAAQSALAELVPGARHVRTRTAATT